MVAVPKRKCNDDNFEYCDPQLEHTTTGKLNGSKKERVLGTRWRCKNNGCKQVIKVGNPTSC